jgi:hypothetical protein
MGFVFIVERGERKIMVFKPGQSGNPLGRALERAKHSDPRSEDLQQFCKERKGDIRRVGEIALKKAVKDEEPWAIKLCMEYFYPKPGTFVAISKEESREVNLNFINALPYEDQQTFLKLWMKSKKGTSAFSAIENMTEECINSGSTINNLKEAEFIHFNTDRQKPD